MCSCNNGLFGSNESWWIIIILAIILLWSCHGNNGCGCGCNGVASANDGCGCGCNSCC